MTKSPKSSTPKSPRMIDLTGLINRKLDLSTRRSSYNESEISTRYSAKSSISKVQSMINLSMPKSPKCQRMRDVTGLFNRKLDLSKRRAFYSEPEISMRCSLKSSISKLKAQSMTHLLSSFRKEPAKINYTNQNLSEKPKISFKVTKSRSTASETQDNSHNEVFQNIVADDNEERLDKKIMNQTNNTYFEKLKIPEELIPGYFDAEFEIKIIDRMKVIAQNRAKNQEWEKAYFILKKILECEKNNLGNDHPQVANTLYNIGIAQNCLGHSDKALSSFEEGLKILLPGKNNIINRDLASILQQLGLIHGYKGEVETALYYLNLSKEIETNILGNPTEETARMLLKFHSVCDSDTRTLC